jgi:hypothetical protein
MVGQYRTISVDVSATYTGCYRADRFQALANLWPMYTIVCKFTTASDIECILSKVSDKSRDQISGSNSVHALFDVACLPGSWRMFIFSLAGLLGSSET